MDACREDPLGKVGTHSPEVERVIKPLREEATEETPSGDQAMEEVTSREEATEETPLGDQAME